MSLLTRVRDYAERHQLWTPETRVVVAVSGGSDSVALLLLLVALADRGALALAGLAHLNHGLRGADADEDQHFCEAMARRLGIPAQVGAADVRMRAKRDRQSLEVAGRHARAAFLDEARRALAGDAIALAHTSDDQAETLLLRLARGAGTRGLGGMAPRRDDRIRPVLDCTRFELQAFLNERGESWREDVSNLDLDNPRNRMRHVVLPQLAELNPHVGAAVARTAAILRADAACLDGLAAEAAHRVLTCGPSRVEVSAAALAELPDALSRRVVLKALETVAPGRSYGLEEVDAVRQAAGRDGALDLPGIRMEPSGPGAVLLRRPVADPHDSPTFRVDLPVPGIARDPAGRWWIEAGRPGPAPDELLPGHTSVAVDADMVAAGLAVRGRAHGDRLQPVGLNGRKKVQDLFVDRKVPRDERDRVPLVVDARGAIVWVAGHALAAPFRVTPRTRAVVVLTLRRF
jgi:tRNA(Ile)-lysidine synthase